MIMKNISPLPLTWILFLALLLSSCQDRHNVTLPPRPNIILLMADDHGYGDLGCTGNPVIETPNIDAMARESAIMDNYYVSPVCAPTRASLMTGRYNYRTGVTDTYVGRAMMHTEEVTLAEVLRSAGYATGIFGKWHLGDNYPMRPQDQGFDEVLMLRGGGLCQPSDPFENHNRYTDPVLFHNGEMIQTHGFCTDVYYDYAIRFIRKNAKEDKPFFAYIPTNAPHAPFHDVPEDLKQYYLNKPGLTSISLEEKPDTGRLAAICAMITNIDQNVGRLFKVLKELDIKENTIVIYTSDNGPNTRRYVGDLRGKKGEVADGGIRNMFFLHWPAVFHGGEHSDVRVAHYDVMPPLLDAAGVPLPDTLHLDGRSFLPLLRGKNTEWPERALFLQWHRGDIPTPFLNFAEVEQQWKLLSSDSSRFELYNLQKDPGEKENLIAQHPEKEKEMKEAYMQWYHDVSSTRPDNYATPRIIIGNDAEPVTELTCQDWKRDSGFGWGDRGHWLLTVEKAGLYDITVRTAEARPGWRVTLTANDLVRKETLPDTLLTFREIPLEEGDLTLSASVTHGDKIVTNIHVFITRKKESRP
jgi:arylsulfatase/arylsulfatase A